MKATWKPQTKKPAGGKRLQQGLPRALFELGRREPGAGRIAAQRNRQQRNRQHQRRQRDQAVRPAETVDQALRNRRIDEHAGRTGGGRQPERIGAPFGADQARHRRQHHAERAGADTQTHQHTAADVQPRRGRRDGHQQHAGDIDQRAGRQHPPGAELVGDQPEQRLADSPEQVLQRHRHAEGAAVPSPFLENRQLKETHRRARTEGQQRDDTGTGNRENRQLVPVEAVQRHAARSG